ncbi:MAG: hypothetical protein IJJ45_04915 [Clostridia bacterium]|nr:hypothetical protein [Clostridia bacterium]
MKQFFSGLMIMLALVLVIVLGVAALAETIGPGDAQAPVVGQQQPAAPADEAPQASTDDDAALQDALRAYNEARQASREQALEDELNGFVSSGKLTQEQADLILKYQKDRQALRSGTCPSCGYQFGDGSGFGRGGRMNGDRGGRGGRGMRGMRGFDQSGADQQPGADMLPEAGQDGGADSAAFLSDWEDMFESETLEDI